MSPRDRGDRRRRRPRRRGLGLVGAFTAAALAQLGVVPLAPLAPADAASLPGGRRTFVISMMDGTPQALAVRLASYEFSTGGKVTETYWAWRQNAISGKGNVRWTKPSSGYTTAGCAFRCPVRTPVGFQKGTRPHTFTGTWTMESPSVLAIRWTPSYPVERWQLDASRPGLVGAKLLTARGQARGWGVGSNASAKRGVSLSKVYAARWITGPFAENAYSPTTNDSVVGWSAQDYHLCGSTCMQSTSMGSGDRTGWYHSYFAANAAVDGRKVYWNNQRGVVQQLESPNTNCISASGGGHTNALLQALDDNGEFVGFVGVEASLNQRKYGQAVVAAYAMLTPDTLPVLGSGGGA